MAQESSSAARQEAFRRPERSLTDAQRDALLKQARTDGVGDKKKDAWGGGGTQREFRFKDPAQLELFGLPKDASVAESRDGVAIIEGTSADGQDVRILHTEERLDEIGRAAAYLDLADAALNIHFPPNDARARDAKELMHGMVTYTISKESDPQAAKQFINRTVARMADLTPEGMHQLAIAIDIGGWQERAIPSGEVGKRGEFGGSLDASLLELGYEEADIADVTNELREVTDEILDNKTAPKKRKGLGMRLFNVAFDVARQIKDEMGRVAEGARKVAVKQLETLGEVIIKGANIALDKVTSDAFAFDLQGLEQDILADMPHVELDEDELPDMNPDDIAAAEAELKATTDEEIDQQELNEMRRALNPEAARGTREFVRFRKQLDAIDFDSDNVAESVQAFDAFLDKMHKAASGQLRDGGVNAALGREAALQMLSDLDNGVDVPLAYYQYEINRKFLQQEAEPVYEEVDEKDEDKDIVFEPADEDVHRGRPGLATRRDVGRGQRPYEVTIDRPQQRARNTERARAGGDLGELTAEQRAELARDQESVDRIARAKTFMKDSGNALFVRGNPELFDLLMLNPNDYLTDKTVVENAGAMDRMGKKVRDARARMKKYDRLLELVEGAPVAETRVRVPLKTTTETGPEARPYSVPVGGRETRNRRERPGTTGETLQEYAEASDAEFTPEHIAKFGKQLKALKEAVMDGLRDQPNAYADVATVLKYDTQDFFDPTLDDDDRRAMEDVYSSALGLVVNSRGTRPMHKDALNPNIKSPYGPDPFEARPKAA